MNAFSGDDKTYDLSLYLLKLKEYKMTNYACGTPAQYIKLPQQYLRHTIGYCIEPIYKTYNTIKEIMIELQYNMSNIHLIQAAVDAYPGGASTLRERAGSTYPCRRADRQMRAWTLREGQASSALQVYY